MGKRTQGVSSIDNCFSLITLCLLNKISHSMCLLNKTFHSIYDNYNRLSEYGQSNLKVLVSCDTIGKTNQLMCT